jgi:hypothetical protein
VQKSVSADTRAKIESHLSQSQQVTTLSMVRISSIYAREDSVAHRLLIQQRVKQDNGQTQEK